MSLHGPRSGHPFCGNLQSYLYGFAPIQDRDAPLILSKDLLVSKTAGTHLLKQQATTAVAIVTGTHPT
jgi:hypothetical protein